MLVGQAADDVAAAWAEGAPDRTEFLADEAMARDELYNQLIATLQSVADKRLKVAVGYDDVEPNPEAADTGAAQRGLDDMVAELDGALASYDAVLGADLEAASEDAARRTRGGLVDGRDLLVALPGRWPRPSRPSSPRPRKPSSRCRTPSAPWRPRWPASWG